MNRAGCQSAGVLLDGGDEEVGGMWKRRTDRDEGTEDGSRFRVWDRWRMEDVTKMDVTV